MGRKNEKGRPVQKGIAKRGRHRLDQAWLNRATEIASKALEAPPKARIYMRACPECGHMTASLDERLLAMELPCPDCNAVAA